MSDSEKIRELEAIIVVLANQLKEVKKKVGLSTPIQSDQSLLNDLKKEASKIKLG